MVSTIITVKIWSLDTLGSEGLKNVLFANSQDLNWDLKSGNPTICNPDDWLPFLGTTIWNWTKMSGFHMVETIAIAIPIVRPSENGTVWNQCLQKVQIFYVSGFWMVWYQITTGSVKSISMVCYSNCLVLISAFTSFTCCAFSTGFK